MQKPTPRAWGSMLAICVLVGGAAACGDGLISGGLSGDGSGAAPRSGSDGGASRANGSGAGRDPSSSSSSPTPAPNGGIPCDVQQLLVTHCVSCHSGSAPTGKLTLTSYADLIADSPAVSGQTVAQTALDRMQNGADPMPPKPASLVPATEIAAFKAWIDSGYAGPACGGADGGGTIADPYATPSVCTSGTKWTRGDHGSSSMHPGGACIDCHDKSNEAPTFDIAGTVYPTAHEPIDCNGVSTALGAKVVVVDSQNHTITLTPNSVGNFYREPRSGSTPFVPPYTAKVVVAGNERAMTTPQTSGDCNDCHTETGTNNAPGRIMAP